MTQRTDDGLRIHVEQMGYRNWMCALYADDRPTPVWGVFAIKTSSERVAVQRCSEMWDGFRAALALENTEAV